jgi:hypothetical protein
MLDGIKNSKINKMALKL